MTKSGKLYRSKIGLEIVLPLAVLLGSVTVLLIVQRAWIPMLFILGLVAFIAHMLLTTYYVIHEDILEVRSGFLYHKKIPISEISRIEKSMIAMSSPAASMDRMELTYSKYDSLVISPKNKSEFLKDLLKINPAIIVKENLQNLLA